MSIYEEQVHTNSQSLIKLIEDIDAQTIVLPEFQRDFVWDISKTYDLFDSLVRDVFIGVIIYGIPSFEITVRQLDDRPRIQKGKRRRKIDVISYDRDEIDFKTRVSGMKLVLDGQQRVTSLYRAVKGIDTLWFVSKNDDDKSYQPENNNFKTLEDNLFQFSGSEDPERLSIRISDIYRLISERILRNEDQKEVLLTCQYAKNIEHNEPEFSDLFNRFLEIVDQFRRLFEAEKFLSYHLLKMNSEKFALFFERSNSRGVQLSFIDVLVAKLYQGFNLRKKSEEFNSNNPTYNLNREVIVRTISFIVSEGSNVDRSYILSNLNYHHFNEYWEEICSLYKKVFDFLLENCFIPSQDWLPYENMMIPIMIFLREIGGDFTNMNEGQNQFISYWYWGAIMSLRFSGSSNQEIILSSKLFQEISHGQPSKFANYINQFNKIRVTSPKDIYYINKKNAIYKGLLCLFHFDSKGLLDWNNSNRLSTNSKLEDHHIFPKSYLKELYNEDDLEFDYIDSVLNRTLVSKFTNVRIGKKAPSVYLRELVIKNPNLPECLKSHFISSDILFDSEWDENFALFIEERANHLYSLVEKYILNFKPPILSEQDISVPEEQYEIVCKPINENQIEEDLTNSPSKSLLNNKAFKTGKSGRETFKIEKYTNIPRGTKCTAVVKYNGSEYRITPHGIRDSICDEQHQKHCESFPKGKERRSIHNTLNYCLKRNLFSDQSLVEELKQIKRNKTLRQGNLTAQIVKKLVEEFNQIDRAQNLGIKFVEIRTEPN
jgi:hypothetical protein